VGVLPAWLAVVVVSRDVMIVAAVILSWVMSRPVAIRPMMLSKVNTAAQIGFAALVLSTKAFGVDLAGFDDVAMLILAALTVASAGAYLAGWMRHMAG
jgi:cardiolipin synthase